MPTEVILPRVDMDMTAGKISKWHVKDGDLVKRGAVIFEIETDKAAMEIESPGEGVIRMLASAGDAAVPVGSVVALIYGAGEAPVSAPRALKSQTPPRIDMPLLTSKPSAETALASALPGGRRATPLARRLARANAIALEGIIGSGPRGRIVAVDVRRVLERGPAAAHTPEADHAVAKAYAPDSVTLIPHDGMRRATARRLLEAKQTIPHFYLAITCDLDNLLAAREQINAGAPRRSGKTPLWRISVNDFLIKALALALERVPEANATWTDGAMLRHHASDIAVAVPVDGGSLTPVIRAAEKKSLSQISAEMKDLAHRAREKKLIASEFQGGTSAISDLGMYGIEQFTAVINPPQASILAVGAAVKRPAVAEGAVTIRTSMSCTLSCDHRVIDGALAAELLGVFRSFVETPALMLA
jgi:pyruvate dehydrogenase E2 component (dihydrolipoamide acetyltransferase)